VTSRHPPVEDWATDFDHTDPGWVADPYPIWEDLLQRCPVAHSDRYGGTWLPVTHELVSEAEPGRPVGGSERHERGGQRNGRVGVDHRRAHVQGQEGQHQQRGAMQALGQEPGRGAR